MSQGTWPTYFPLPKISSYTATDEQAFLRTNVEGGPAKQRREFTQVPAAYNATFIMSTDVFGVFRGFWKYTISEGSDWFTIPLDTGNSATAGQPTDQTARFIQTYSARRISHTHWSVDGVLEVDDPSTIDQDDLAILLMADDIFAMQILATQAETTLNELEILMVNLTNL